MKKLLLLLTAACVLFACTQEDAKTNDQIQDIRPVRTISITPNAISERNFPGVIKAAQQVHLSFRVSGEINNILVKESTDVKAGDLIATLDDRDFKIQFDSKNAEYKRAKRDFERAATLKDQGAISGADYDKLKAQMTTAQSAMEQAKKNLDDTKLYAPFSGVIARLNQDNFEKTSSSIVFAELHDLSNLAVVIQVPESVMRNIRTNQRRIIEAELPDPQNTRVALSLDEVSTKADSATQTYRVTFLMPTPQEVNLLPGMSINVHAQLISNDGSASFRVPSHAVLQDEKGQYVWIVDDINDNQGITKRRSVNVGQLYKEGLELTSGVAPGDHIITAGMSKMSEGKIVKLLTLSKPTPNTAQSTTASPTPNNSSEPAITDTHSNTTEKTTENTKEKATGNTSPNSQTREQ